MFLISEELTSLTGRQRRTAQVRQLRSMGIEHRLRADGSIAVLKAHVERVFGAGESVSAKRRNQEVELDWSVQ
jgi:Domain of unknown function (DUF4224)